MQLPALAEMDSHLHETNNLKRKKSHEAFEFKRKLGIIEFYSRKKKPQAFETTGSAFLNGHVFQ